MVGWQTMKKQKLAAWSTGVDCAFEMESWQEMIWRSESKSAFKSSFGWSLQWNTISDKPCQLVVCVLPRSIKCKEGVQDNTCWKGRAFRALASLHKTPRFYHRLLCHLVHWSLLRPFRRRSFQSFRSAEDMWLELLCVLWQYRLLGWDSWLAGAVFAPTTPGQSQRAMWKRRLYW